MAGNPSSLELFFCGTNIKQNRSLYYFYFKICLYKFLCVSFCLILAYHLTFHGKAVLYRKHFILLILLPLFLLLCITTSTISSRKRLDVKTRIRVTVVAHTQIHLHRYCICIFICNIVHKYVFVLILTIHELNNCHHALQLRIS